MMDTEEKNRVKEKMPSVATPKAYHIRGWIGLINGTLEEYDKLTTFLLGGGMVGAIWVISKILDIL